MKLFDKKHYVIVDKDRLTNAAILMNTLEIKFETKLIKNESNEYQWKLTFKTDKKNMRILSIMTEHTGIVVSIH